MPNYLLDGEAPEGLDVFLTPDLDARPADVPESARATKIYGNRREWQWEDESGAFRRFLTRKKELPSRSALGATLQEPEAREEKEEEEKLSENDQNFFNSAISALVKPVDMVTDTLMDAHFGGQKIVQDTFTKVTGIPFPEQSPNAEKIVRGVAKEMGRAAALETAIILMTPGSGGSSHAGQAAVGASAAKALQYGKQLFALRAAALAQKGTQVRNAALLTGGISAGLGAINPDMASQSDEEFARDVSTEVGGEAGRILATQLNLTRALPKPMQPVVKAFLASGKWPMLRKTILQPLAGRTAGNYAGYKAAGGPDFADDPLTFGLELGVPGFFNLIQAGKAGAVLHNTAGFDPADVSIQSPSASAYRLSDELLEKRKDVVDRINLTHDEVKQAALLNELQHIDEGLAISKAAYLSDTRLRDKMTKKVSEVDQLMHTGIVGESQARALFSPGFAEGDLEGLALALDQIRIANTTRLAKDAALMAFAEATEEQAKAIGRGEAVGDLAELVNAKATKAKEGFNAWGFPAREGQDWSWLDGLANSDKLNAGVEPAVRAARLEARWKKLNDFLNASFESPSRFRQYGQFINSLERHAAEGGPETLEALAPITEKLKNAIVTKGILGSAFQVERLAEASGPAGHRGMYKFDLTKMNLFVNDKENVKVFKSVFGAEETQTIQDIVGLMAFQGKRSASVDAVPKGLNRILNFSSAHLAFEILVSGGASGGKGAGMAKLLGLTAAGESAKSVAVSASRFIQMGVAKPKEMRELIQAVYSGNAIKQQRLWRSLVRDYPEVSEMSGEREEDVGEEVVEEPFGLFQ